MIDPYDSKLLAKLIKTKCIARLGLAWRHSFVKRFAAVGKIAKMSADDKKVIMEAKAEYLKKGGVLPQPPDREDRRREE